MDLFCYVCGARSSAGHYNEIEDVDGGPECPDCGAQGFVELVEPLQVATASTNEQQQQSHSIHQDSSRNRSPGSLARYVHSLSRTPALAAGGDAADDNSLQRRPTERPPSWHRQAGTATELPLDILDGLLLHMNQRSRPTSRTAIEALPRVTVSSKHHSKAVDLLAKQHMHDACQQSVSLQQHQIQAQQQPAQLGDNSESHHTSSPRPCVTDDEPATSSNPVPPIFCSAGEPCPVCHEEFQAGCEVVQLPCQHCFHEACLLPWLTEHNTCPVCRYELEASDSATAAASGHLTAQGGMHDLLDIVLQQLMSWSTAPAQQHEQPQEQEQHQHEPGSRHPQTAADSGTNSTNIGNHIEPDAPNVQAAAAAAASSFASLQAADNAIDHVMRMQGNLENTRSSLGRVGTNLLRLQGALEASLQERSALQEQYDQLQREQAALQSMYSNLLSEGDQAIDRLGGLLRTAREQQERVQQQVVGASVAHQEQINRHQQQQREQDEGTRGDRPVQQTPSTSGSSSSHHVISGGVDGGDRPAVAAPTGRLPAQRPPTPDRRRSHSLGSSPVAATPGLLSLLPQALTAASSSSSSSGGQSRALRTSSFPLTAAVSGSSSSSTSTSWLPNSLPPLLRLSRLSGQQQQQQQDCAHVNNTAAGISSPVASGSSCSSSGRLLGSSPVTGGSSALRPPGFFSPSFYSSARCSLDRSSSSSSRPGSAPVSPHAPTQPPAAFMAVFPPHGFSLPPAALPFTTSSSNNSSSGNNSNTASNRSAMARNSSSSSSRADRTVVRHRSRSADGAGLAAAAVSAVGSPMRKLSRCSSSGSVDGRQPAFSAGASPVTCTVTDRSPLQVLRRSSSSGNTSRSHVLPAGDVTRGAAAAVGAGIHSSAFGQCTHPPNTSSSSAADTCRFSTLCDVARNIWSDDADHSSPRPRQHHHQQQQQQQQHLPPVPPAPPLPPTPAAAATSTSSSSDSPWLLLRRRTSSGSNGTAGQHIAATAAVAAAVVDTGQQHQVDHPEVNLSGVVDKPTTSSCPHQAVPCDSQADVVDTTCSSSSAVPCDRRPAFASLGSRNSTEHASSSVVNTSNSDVGSSSSGTSSSSSSLSVMSRLQGGLLSLMQQADDLLATPVPPAPPAAASGNSSSSELELRRQAMEALTASITATTASLRAHSAAAAASNAVLEHERRVAAAAAAVMNSQAAVLRQREATLLLQAQVMRETVTALTTGSTPAQSLAAATGPAAEQQQQLQQQHEMDADAGDEHCPPVVSCMTATASTPSAIAATTDLQCSPVTADAVALLRQQVVTGTDVSQQQQQPTQPESPTAPASCSAVADGHRHSSSVPVSVGCRSSHVDELSLTAIPCHAISVSPQDADSSDDYVLGSNSGSSIDSGLQD